jgi:hypothetical protein
MFSHNIKKDGRKVKGLSGKAKAFSFFKPVLWDEVSKTSQF